LFLTKTNRKIIPRWRDFKTTTSLGQLAAQSSSDSDLQLPAVEDLESYRAWQSNRSVWHALDLVGSAFVVDGTAHPAVIEAAEYLTANKGSIPPASRHFVDAVFHQSDDDGASTGILFAIVPEQLRRDIHSHRERLLEEPRNAVLWVDLARLYTNLGQFEKSTNAIDRALFLAPESRFVIRCAARFLVHIGNAERALKLLRSADLSESDPWIVAAEIGVASHSDEDPAFLKRGHRMIQSRDFSAFAKSELASAIATCELNEGNRTAAKKLFRQSLVLPTENSVAQAEWASSQVGQLIVPSQVDDVPRTFEANFLYGYRIGDWELARSSAEQWLKDQPFSSRPAAVLSHLYESVFERFEDAIRIVHFGLKSNPEDRGLQNNEAFALIRLNRLDEAERLLARIDFTERDDSATIALTATKGLLLFRRGFVSAGRTLYLRAIEIAKKLSNYRYATMAAIYLAMEEIRVHSETKGETIKMAAELGKPSEDLLVHVLLARMLELDRVSEIQHEEPGAS
jgi:tetratricopeptide (TPR) repeat protein